MTETNNFKILFALNIKWFKHKFIFKIVFVFKNEFDNALFIFSSTKL